MQGKNLILLPAFIIVILSVSSCKHDPLLQPIFIETGGIEEVACDSTIVYFEEQILPIFQGCAASECHDVVSAEEGIMLNNYNNIINTGDIEPGDPSAGDIYEVITESDLDDRMPPEPNDPLSQESIDLIYNWILQGAVENSCPDLICDTLEVTFSGDILPMTTSFCGACHTGISPYGVINLTNYENISDAASSSDFLDIIDGNIDVVMPENTDGLSDCQVRMFEIWIEDGLPNN